MRPPLSGVLGTLVLAAGVVTWSQFASTVYPYTISVPSTFTHVLITDAANRKIDYFFPALGSFTTNVNVYAEPGYTLHDGVSYLRGKGGRNVHRMGYLTVAGQRRPLMTADFRGLAGHWTVEEISFQASGLVWRLSASYDVKYRKLEPTLLRMLRSFRLRAGARVS